ncbi:MAG: hypothetical protein JF611_14560 [Betaproteobacteria bacterium]|nr:hypothetical protein [Betaproteobacteria bacterium]
MLKEIHGVADDPPAKRRWFHDEYFDLFIWQTGEEVTLFQLCYGIDSSDRALVWDKRRGFFHDGPPAPDEVVARFDDAATALPEDIRAELRALRALAGTLTLVAALGVSAAVSPRFCLLLRPSCSSAGACASPQLRQNVGSFSRGRKP